MQVVLIGNAVLHEATEHLLQEGWTVAKFNHLDEFLNQLSADAEDYVLWIHFDSSISDDTFLGKKAPVVLISTTTGLTHISPSLYNFYEKSNSILTLKGETQFLRQITSTAEHAWLLILMLTSRVQFVIKAAEEGKYIRSLTFKPKQVSEMSIGIIGCGRLGSIVYQYAKAFGMRVWIYDIDAEKYELNSIDSSDISSDLETLILNSEIITIHANSTVGTEPIIGPKQIELLNHGTYIVNTSRANLVDGHSLISKLATGLIGGYAADVQFSEDLDGDYQLDSQLEALQRSGLNILVTPHIGGGTASAILKCESFLVERLNSNFLKPL